MRTIMYFVSIIFMFSANILNAQQNSVSKIERDLGTQIEKIISETGIPSISYAIFSADSLILCNAIGYSNVPLKIPASKTTIYNTGSTFKVVTAMGIMQLHASNHLNIDSSIAKYLKDTPYYDFDKDSPVTLRHLLSHRSGLNGETIKIPIWERNGPEPLDSIITGITPYQKPGIEFKYCNHCYGIAGYIIQNVTGQTFNEYIRSNFLEPLSIKNIAPFKPTPKMIERMALPYYREKNMAIPTSIYRYNVYPAGDAYFTPSDMAKLLIPQLNNGYYYDISVLDSSGITEMQKNHFTPNNYGLGLGVTITNDRKLLLHGGSVPGFSAYFILDTKLKKGIYMMANCGDIGDILLALSNYAIRLLGGENLQEDLPGFAKKEYQEIVLPIEILRKYEGKYELAPEFFVHVFLEAKDLFIQVSGQSKVQVFPYEKNKFYIKVTDAQIVFDLDSNNHNGILTLFQSGKSIKGNKI